MGEYVGIPVLYYKVFKCYSYSTMVVATNYSNYQFIYFLSKLLSKFLRGKILKQSTKETKSSTQIIDYRSCVKY